MSEQDLLNSAIYSGKVTHARYTPASNSFTYDTFMAYLDLDELEMVFSRSRLWSLEKFNLVSFFRKDYFGNKLLTLKQAVIDRIEDETGSRIKGKIFLLTNLRYLGHITNPISCYYCFDEHKILRFVLAEVTNTPWGERQSYIISCNPEKKINRQVFDKEMYVSPFMPMDIQYHWQHTVPGEQLNLSINCHNDDSRVLSAHLNLERLPITAKLLRQIALSRSLMTIKVTLTTYWQAIKLLIKGVPLVKKPSQKKALRKGESVNEIQRTQN